MCVVTHYVFLCLTWSSVSLFHPNVAVALSHTGLRVKERHSDAPLSTQPGIVVMTLLHGIPVVLLSQPDTIKPEPYAGYLAYCLKAKISRCTHFKTSAGLLQTFLLD